MKLAREIEKDGVKELLLSIKTLVFASIVTVLLLPAYLYSIGYAVWTGVTLKDWKAPFRFIWSLINGTLLSIAWLLTQLAIFLDFLWNVLGGEAIEDMLTTRENTQFTKGKTTVSQAAGREMLDGYYKDNMLWFSKVVNKVFRQKNHFKGAIRKKDAIAAVDILDYYETLNK